MASNFNPATNLKPFGLLESHEVAVMKKAAARRGAEMLRLAFTNQGEAQWVPSNNFGRYPSQIHRVVIPDIKPSCEWEAVSVDFNWLARDRDGQCRFYATKPELGSKSWNFGRKSFPAEVLSELDPGSCDWKDSLVCRPGTMD